MMSVPSSLLSRDKEGFSVKDDWSVSSEREMQGQNLGEPDTRGKGELCIHIVH